MYVFIDITVDSGLVIACLFAISPTMISPLSFIFTTEGVVLPPSALGIIVKFPPYITATHEFVVPKSIPIILLISISPFCYLIFFIYFYHCWSDYFSF